MKKNHVERAHLGWAEFRLHPMPSRPSAQACRNMRCPSAASMCSEKILQHRVLPCG